MQEWVVVNRFGDIIGGQSFFSRERAEEYSRMTVGETYVQMKTPQKFPWD